MMLLDIYCAIQQNDKERVFSLLEQNIDGLKSDSELCKGLLNWFIVKGHFEGIQLILNHGGDPNTQDEKLLSLLHWACYKGLDDLVENLLVLGADVNIKDMNGRTPLHLACEFGREKIVSLLLSYGADSECEDCNCVTPRDRALNVNVFEALLRSEQQLKREGECLDDILMKCRLATQQQVNALWQRAIQSRLESRNVQQDFFRVG